MFQRKQIYYINIIGVLFLCSITFLFYYFYSTKNYELTLTKKEIAGIYQLKDVFDVMMLSKYNRGMSQIDQNHFKEQSFEDLEISVEKINNKNVSRFFKRFKEKMPTAKQEEVFVKYTELVRILEKEMVNIGDDSTLLFESDRQNYFLMTFLVYSLSNITDNIGHIRALGAKVLKDGMINIGEIYNLERYQLYFYENVSSMEHLLSKLDKRKASRLTSKLNTAKREFAKLNLKIEQLTNSEFDLDANAYFSMATHVMTEVIDLYEEVKVELIADLDERRNTYEQHLLESIVIYIILLVSTVLLMIYLIRKEKAFTRHEEIETLTESFLSQTRDALHEVESLKDLCSISLRILSERFHAINGSLYIYNNKNRKLFLGSSYNVDKKNLQYQLDYNVSFAGEVMRSGEIKAIPIKTNLSVGIVELEVHSVITIPLINADLEIGVIQLTVLKELDSFELKIIEKVSTIMSNYLYKARENDDSLRYVELVDKNVLTSSTDLRGKITYASEAFCLLSQYTKEELVGANHNIIRHEEMTEDIFKDLWSTVSKGKVWKGEIKNKKKDGTFYWVESIISPDYDLYENIIGYTAIRTDITLKKQFEESSITDMLTGLYNRRHFEKSFPEQLNLSRRNNNYLVFALMDIDHFKQYNDTYGHQEGDRALKLVADALSGVLKRNDDMSFRLGGEEFGMIYKVSDKESALTIANHARETVENINIPHKNNSASEYVTISMGVYIMEKTDELDIEYVYKSADDALYEAKETGRNKVVIFQKK
jgi:diguanylate cyclase (GGDEF)-like protein/PAS domain S-box-containing protein